MGQSTHVRRAHRAALLLLVCGLLTACAPAAPVRPATSAPPAQPDAVLAQARGADPAALVVAERNAAAARNLAALAALWSADAQIVELRSASGPTCQYTWTGRDAILDRYTVAVFPNPPQPWTEAPARSADVSGASATLHNGVDTWRFVRRDGRWWIAELVIAD